MIVYTSLPYPLILSYKLRVVSSKAGRPKHNLRNLQMLVHDFAPSAAPKPYCPS